MCQGTYWQNSRFSDQDLFMQYGGGGVGHLGTHQCNNILLANEDAPPDTLDNVDSAKQGKDWGSDSEGEASRGKDNGNLDDIREDDNEGEGGEDDGCALDEGVDDEVDEGQNNNNDNIITTSNDSGIVTAAGFAALWYICKVCTSTMVCIYVMTLT